jgi:5-bromo-4-chloroindolyl phosphate hydrolysis protein
MKTTNLTNDKWLETLEQMIIDMPNLKMARTCYDYLRTQGVAPTESQSVKLFQFWKNQSNRTPGEKFFNLEKRSGDQKAKNTQNTLEQTLLTIQNLRNVIFDDGKRTLDEDEVCIEFESKIAGVVDKTEINEYVINKTIKILQHLAK